MTQYAQRDHQQLDHDGGYYCRHVSAMTQEELHSKSAIAGELAWRDQQIDTLRAQLADAHAALKVVMRNAVLAKEPCDPDPESASAIRNGKFASLAAIAAQGLGMLSGPSLTQKIAEAQRDSARWRSA